MIVLGLTGGVASGKTATARLFARQGAAVFDADAAVHRLYAGGETAAAIAAAFPGVALPSGAIDRRALGARVAADRAALARLEAIVHPVVRAEEAAFVARARQAGTPVVVLDIPLLFEAGRDAAVDAVVAAIAPAAVRRARVLARPGYDAAALAALEARQLPAAEKARRAHFVVDTGSGEAAAAGSVRAIMRALAAAAAAR